MNLYLLTQNECTGYDSFDSVVVAAKSEEDAKTIHPYGEWPKSYSGGWCDSPESVTVKTIGKAVKGTERGVILASFNAG
jgi:hypothetical protein